MKYLWLLILLYAGVAQADPRDDIQKQYNRSTEATKLKYLDGVYCIRTPEFKLFNQEGMRLDLTVERTRWEQIILPAVSVDEKLEILSFEQPSKDRALCDVSYTTNVVTVNRLTDKDVKQVLYTKCRDEWVQTPKGWRLASSRVTDQTYKR